MKTLATVSCLFAIAAIFLFTTAIGHTAEMIEPVKAATGAAAPTGGGEDDASALAKQTQNPIANLISLPLQNNFNFGAGTENGLQWILNAQLAAFYNVVSPDTAGADWQLRAQLQFLFPK